MIAMLLATLANAADPNLTCLTPAEVETRILEPLHRLDRCQREVEILTRSHDECARVIASEHAGRQRAEAALREADRRRRRANRRAAVAGPSGAAVGALLVVLLVLL